MQPLGKDAGNIIFVKMQLPGNALQCQRLLKVQGDIGDELIAHIGILLSVPGSQLRLRHQIGQNQVQPGLADSAGMLRIMEHPIECKGNVRIAGAGSKEGTFGLLLTEKLIVFFRMGGRKNADNSQAGILCQITVYHIRKDERGLTFPDFFRLIGDGDLQSAFPDEDQLHLTVQVGGKGDVLAEKTPESYLLVFVKRPHICESFLVLALLLSADMFSMLQMGVKIKGETFLSIFLKLKNSGIVVLTVVK